MSENFNNLINTLSKLSNSYSKYNNQTIKLKSFDADSGIVSFINQNGGSMTFNIKQNGGKLNNNNIDDITSSYMPNNNSYSATSSVNNSVFIKQNGGKLNNSDVDEMTSSYMPNNNSYSATSSMNNSVFIKQNGGKLNNTDVDDMPNNNSYSATSSMNNSVFIKQNGGKLNNSDLDDMTSSYMPNNNSYSATSSMNNSVFIKQNGGNLNINQNANSESITSQSITSLKSSINPATNKNMNGGGNYSDTLGSITELIEKKNMKGGTNVFVKSKEIKGLEGINSSSTSSLCA